MTASVPNPTMNTRAGLAYAKTLGAKGQLFLTPAEADWLRKWNLQRSIDVELEKLHKERKSQ